MILDTLEMCICDLTREEVTKSNIKEVMDENV